MELSIDGQQIKLFDIDKEEADRTRKVDGVTLPLEVRTQVTAGMHSVGVAFVKKNYAAAEDIFSSTRLRSSISVLDVSRSVVPHISSVAVGGPYNISGVSDTASRRQIFTCRPASADAEARCAEQILSILARRAFRRPTNPDDITLLMGFYKEGRTKGNFDSGIEMALAAHSRESRFSLSAQNANPITSRRGRPIGSAIWNWHRVCRSSSGAAFPTTNS
jgi:hypothetical protein